MKFLSKAAVGGLTVAGMGVVIYAMAINPKFIAVLGPIFIPYVVMGLAVLATILRPPEVFRLLAKGEDGKWEVFRRLAKGEGGKWAEGWLAFWYGAFPSIASCVICLSLVGLGVAVARIINVDTIVVWPIAALALLAMRRYLTRWRDTWLVSVLPSPVPPPDTGLH